MAITSNKAHFGPLGWATYISRFFRRIPTGIYFAAPLVLYLILFFFGPLFYVAGLAFMPSGMTSIELFAEVSPGEKVGAAREFLPSFASFERLFEIGYSRPFIVSAQLAVLSTGLLVILCYPLAFGLAKVFSRFAPLFTMLFLMPLFVSETIRLYGLSLFFLKGGILNGLFDVLGLAYGELMYTKSIIVLGLVNIYFPFMLFPMVIGISLVDNALVAAARDLGASRLRTFLKIELPLAMPGIVIGVMLTFVLTLGSMSESQILGGQKVMMIAHSIDFAFTWQQDWPLGAALSLLLIVITLALMIWLLARIDFDKLFRRQQ